jgi:arginyl-tRNA synthetase
VREAAESLAEEVGVGGVIFSEFTQRRLKDVSFTWEKAINLQGDSGPYLQYTHARLSSMLRKYGRPVVAAAPWGRLGGLAVKEIFLKLADYHGALAAAESENEPSLVASYLLELCALFNRLYTDKENHRFISDDRDLTAAYMALAEAVRLTLAHGLGLLGLAAPQAM